MPVSPAQKRLAILVIGLVILFAPALFVVATLEFLILSGDLALSEISLLEFVELYLIDLVLFVLLGYGVYRLTFWLIENQLPEALDSVDETEATDATDEAEPSGGVNEDRS
ncbi:hypothetical protein HISP_04025 [Haloarcula hispanica N601]|uniref:Uncharacterized protein n=3 Tax=Haloarcula hispanica TaxID=51589 RepID=A0A482SYP5_HALHI|nr:MULTISPECIES: hypothetical protein [Haloarcula]AEM56400.1 conserved hypothetical protein [Haloarcula hispanica ATCC 33960]AHB65213.1 hypothetical protein HISP_04025 [Haloarcula hispanica N601]AJF26355.1 hypothetical protein SG26_11755 [Haloarcula sp. CBA1115]KAA9407824.1 hypothetical protein Har1131_13765 [Haloarcula sp. CBA1131]KAA9409128.1 hypothetical protein EGO51_04745 [Haloarcula hispanica]